MSVFGSSVTFGLSMDNDMHKSLPTLDTSTPQVKS